MDSLHLREILLKIGKDVRCPMCNSMVAPQDIQLMSIENKENECDMEVTCHHCQFSFGGRAKMMNMVLPEGKKFNASSLVTLQKNPLEKEISPTEQSSFKNALHSSQSLSQLL